MAQRITYKWQRGLLFSIFNFLKYSKLFNLFEMTMEAIRSDWPDFQPDDRVRLDEVWHGCFKLISRWLAHQHFTPLPANRCRCRRLNFSPELSERMSWSLPGAELPETCSPINGNSKWMSSKSLAEWIRSADRIRRCLQQPSTDRSSSGGHETQQVRAHRSNLFHSHRSLPKWISLIWHFSWTC